MKLVSHSGGVLLLLLSLLSFSSNTVFSQSDIMQSVKVSGIVTDKSTGESLIGVTILRQDSTGTATDIDGKYELDMDPGRQKLVFSYIGYENQNRIVNIASEENIQLN
ncbi:MAG: hypothetical protein ACI959_002116, partial [Limisphaerales bacterium]